jgi:hypothetical protein
MEIEETKYPFIGLLMFHARKGTGRGQTVATASSTRPGNKILLSSILTGNQLKLLGPDDSLGVSLFNYGSRSFLFGGGVI